MKPLCAAHEPHVIPILIKGFLFQCHWCVEGCQICQNHGGCFEEEHVSEWGNDISPVVIFVICLGIVSAQIKVQNIICMATFNSWSGVWRLVSQVRFEW